MKNSYLFRWLFIFSAFLSFTACDTNPDSVVPNSPFAVNQAKHATAATFFDEGFESASKTSYATGSVPFTNGSWNFDDALVGNTSSDSKTGAQSARIRYSGKLSMEFDLPDGAKSIALSYGKYGRDKSTSFEVYYSTNSGTSWTLAGTPTTASKTNLNTVTFTLDVQGPVRFEVRKTDGSSNRLNIDDVRIESNPAPDPATSGAISEDYEGGSKGSYTAGAVTLASGNWYLNEALLGTLDSDRKTGLKSARIRDLGTLEMQFDVQGAQGVSISHAVYGTDAASTWELQASTNGGGSWAKVGNTVTSASTALATETFSVNYAVPVRFRVVKLSGTGDRINIDDFVISGTAIDTGGGGTGGTAPPADTSLGGVHLSLGNPSNAVTDVNQPNNYLLRKEEYVISYSRDRGTANWVSWHLDEAWLGSTPRQDDFRADITLPSGWYQVGATDYSLSGFDRGHMCPSADRTLSVDDNSNTFLMTNMVPQAPNNNRIGWASLESYCRSLLSGGYEVYIISGGYGVGGTGANGYATTLAGGKITVPSNTWKVVVIIPDGDNDAARVTTGTRVIAIDMPNDNSVSSDWRVYRTSVDAIEAKTGLDLLNLVADNVENVIEASIDAL